MGTSVYIHTSPAGKVYIGIAENPLQRWANGCGYKDNALFSADIQLYGWDSFKHEIIAECQSREEAERLERDFILLLDSENPEKGYNQTHIKADLQRLLTERQPKAKPQPIETPSPFTEENAYKDYLLLAQLPQFEEIRQALTYIANLPQFRAKERPIEWVQGEFYEIPKNIYETADKNERFLYFFSPSSITMHGKGRYTQTEKISIVHGGLFINSFCLLTQNNITRYFISDIAPQYAAEMLFSFSVCEKMLAILERGETN